MGVIKKIRAPIDKALDALIDWIVKMAKSCSQGVRKKDKPDERTDAQKQADLDKAMAEANALIGNKELTLDEVKKGIADVKKRFNIPVLEIRKDSETDAEESDYVYGEINPNWKTATIKRRLRFVPAVSVDFECAPDHAKAGLRPEFEKQVRDQESGLNRLKLEDWETNVQNYAESGRATSALRFGEEPAGAKEQGGVPRQVPREANQKGRDRGQTSQNRTDAQKRRKTQRAASPRRCEGSRRSTIPTRSQAAIPRISRASGAAGSTRRSRLAVADQGPDVESR